MNKGIYSECEPEYILFMLSVKLQKKSSILGEPTVKAERLRRSSPMTPPF
jgi:hypothetical protein